jgi:poly(hydroxyalkanoate) depolymerase family esterase
MFGFGAMPAIEAAADQYGFIMIFPQTTNQAGSNNCWDVGSKASLTHNGGGDTQAIAEMVQYEIAHRGANPDRVYAMGDSSGAMLTEALMAVYPDVFKAGAEFSGVPAGCFSDGWTTTSNWSSACAAGTNTMSAQAWGDLARGMYPGYMGYRPRLQLWHGTADTTINFNDQTQAILQWTNVLGLSQTPNSTDTTSVSGFTIEKWQNSCGFTVLEAHTQQNGMHNTPFDATSVIDFFGLTQVTGPDAQVAACDGGASSGSSGGSDGGGASSSSSGVVGSSGASGSGSSGSSTASSGGNPGSSTSSSSGSGTASSGGSGATGGSSGGAGASASSGGADASTSSGAGVPDAPSSSSGGGCGLSRGQGSTAEGTMAAAGLLGIALFGRRRRRRA